MNNSVQGLCSATSKAEEETRPLKGRGEDLDFEFGTIAPLDDVSWNVTDNVWLPSIRENGMKGRRGANDREDNPEAASEMEEAYEVATRKKQEGVDVVADVDWNEIKREPCVEARAGLYNGAKECMTEVRRCYEERLVIEARCENQRGPVQSATSRTDDHNQDQVTSSLADSEPTSEIRGKMESLIPVETVFSRGSQMTVPLVVHRWRGLCTKRARLKRKRMLRRRLRISRLRRAWSQWFKYTFIYKNADQLYNPHTRNYKEMSPADRFRNSARCDELRSEIRSLLEQLRVARLPKRVRLLLREKPRRRSSKEHSNQQYEWWSGSMPTKGSGRRLITWVFFSLTILCATLIRAGCLFLIGETNILRPAEIVRWLVTAVILLLAQYLMDEGKVSFALLTDILMTSCSHLWKCITQGVRGSTLLLLQDGEFVLVHNPNVLQHAHSRVNVINAFRLHQEISALACLWICLVCYCVRCVDRVVCWIHNGRRERGRPSLHVSSHTKSIVELSKLSKLIFQVDATTELVSRLEAELNILQQDSAGALGCEDIEHRTSTDTLLQLLETTKVLDNLALKVLEAADAHAIHVERRPVIDRTTVLCHQVDALLKKLEAALVKTSTGMYKQDAFASPAPESSPEINSEHDSELFAGQKSKTEHRLRGSRENPDQVDGPLRSTPATTIWCCATGRMVRPEAPLSSDHESAHLYQKIPGESGGAPRRKSLTRPSEDCSRSRSCGSQGVVQNEDAEVLCRTADASQLGKIAAPLMHCNVSTHRYPLRGKKQPISDLQPDIPGKRIVYVAGKIRKTSIDGIRDLIEQFHRNPAVQKYCVYLENQGEKYLKVSTTFGKGLKTRTSVPGGTELCYYVGMANEALLDPPGNHSMELGNLDGIDIAVNATALPDDLPLGKCLHLVNHSCTSNCRVELILFEGPGGHVGMLRLITTMSVDKDTALTIPYAGTMFVLYETLPSAVPRGFRKIRCGCAAGSCPKALGRLDVMNPKPSQRVPRDWGGTMAGSRVSTHDEKTEDDPALADVTPDGTEIELLDVSTATVASIPLAVGRRQQIQTLFAERPGTAGNAANSLPCHTKHPAVQQGVRDAAEDARPLLKQQTLPAMYRGIVSAHADLPAVGVNKQQNTSLIVMLAKADEASHAIQTVQVHESEGLKMAIPNNPAMAMLAQGSKTVTKMLTGTQNAPVQNAEPDEGRPSISCSSMQKQEQSNPSPQQQSFNRSLPNVGNTCFFNSAMQLLASLPQCVSAVFNQKVPENLEPVSLCLAYLKLLIPAIVEQSTSPSHVLHFPKTLCTSRVMSMSDLKDFVTRVTSQYDATYSLGKQADPGDLLKYVLSILPAANTLFSFRCKLTIRPSCACSAREQRVYAYSTTDVDFRENAEETAQRRRAKLCLLCPSTQTIPRADSCPMHARGNRTVPSLSSNPVPYYPVPRVQAVSDIQITLQSNASFQQHVTNYFAPESVIGYQCEFCNLLSSDCSPADKRCVLLSLPSLLMITITAKPGPDGRPCDEHKYGPLHGFETLELPGMQCTLEQCKYTLCAAIMYSKGHHWTYLHGPPAVYISDRVSRIATSRDKSDMTKCARVLVYQQVVPAQSMCETLGSPTRTPLTHVHAVVNTTSAGATASPIPAIRISTPVLSATLKAVGAPTAYARRSGSPRVPGMTKRTTLTCTSSITSRHAATSSRQSTLNNFLTLDTLASRSSAPSKVSSHQLAGDKCEPELSSVGSKCDSSETRVTPAADHAEGTAPRRGNAVLPDPGPRGAQKPLERTSLPAEGSASPNNAHSPALPLQPPLFLDRKIVVKGASPVATPWVPGTEGLYPRPKGAHRSEVQAPAFPIWNLHEKGKCWQQAMFLAADRIEQAQRESANVNGVKFKSPTLYVAADVWTRKNGKEWGLGKIFGAFRNPADFVSQLLELSHTRCFYEIIRADRECKAYFDLEAEPGVWNEEQGREKCRLAIREWEQQVQRRWPAAQVECSRCLAHMILDGSRMTDAGWKVSYHVIYPWLVFPCNTTMLKFEAEALSTHAAFQYVAKNGVVKSFVDPAVYTKNRQFRMLLSYKLSDKTRTALHLSSSPTMQIFLNSCITCIGPKVWRVPIESIISLRAVHPSRTLPDGSAVRPTRPATRLTADESEIMVFIKKCLRAQGYPEGYLALTSDRQSYRWGTSAGVPRPCQTAQIWRPLQPEHKSNGARISVSPTGQVFLQCLHEQCRKVSNGQRWYLGTLPPELLSPEAVSVTRCVHGPANTTRKRVPAQEATELAQGLQRGRARVRQRSPNSHRDPCWPEEVQEGSTPQPTHQEEEGFPNTEPNEAAEEARRRTPELRLPALHIHHTRASSMIRIEAENQSDEPEAFRAWHAVTGPFGGRLGSAGRAIAAEECPDKSTERLDPPVMKEIAEWCNLPPFSAPAPAQLIEAVSAVLEAENNNHAVAAQGTLAGWTDAFDTRQDTTDPSDPAVISANTWTVCPGEKWFAVPASRRPDVGHRLIRSAQMTLDGGAVAVQGDCPAPDLWVNPFVVSYLNIGFRRLKQSLNGVAQSILHHRPDVLFLGDLGVARNKVGKLKQMLERDLGDEWFMLTDISAPQANQRSTGMAAVIHCSLAKHITQVEIQCPIGAEQVMWAKTVAGRIMHLQLSRANCPHTWHLVGLYQYVAKPANTELRRLILSTLEQILKEAQAAGHKVMLLGDVNAAPRGGRWGYSLSSRLTRVDDEMDMWVSRQSCREIMGAKLQATWAACQGVQRAILDRAFIFPAQEKSSPMTVAWNRAIFDHALVTVRLPHSTAGIGYAGVSCPDNAVQRGPRCKVDLKKWNKCRDEWYRLLILSLDQEDGEGDEQPPDPFQALKNGELIAEAIAYKLAPKRVPRAGEVRRSFCFQGNRVLFRELNLLRAARALVAKVLQKSTDFASCPHREILWTTVVSQLPQKIRRSGYPCPPNLDGTAGFYLSQAARNTLQDWVERARIASEVRHAAIRDAYDQARYINIQSFRQQLMRSGGTLDQHTLRAALGKRQPRQRMWGIAGCVVLGVAFELDENRLGEALAQLKQMSAATMVVQVVKSSAGLQLWFRGPRQAGDFLVQWCTEAHALRNVKIHALPPPAHYVATDPDDMLAVQEWHMANEGLDTESICKRCQSAGIQPITTTAKHQSCGNPDRAVRFFCARCQSVNSGVALKPLAPCPLPLSILQAARTVPAGTLAQISRFIDHDTLEACVRALPTGKSVGTDGIPREFYKYAPRSLLELLRAAINAYLTGKRPTVCGHEWMGAIVTFIAKQLSALQVTEFRPVASICTKFVVFLNIISKRLERFTEEQGLLEDAQEAFRRNRSTTRQLCKLQCLLDAQRRAKSLSVMLYLDLANAFNAMNHRAIFHILRLCGFPDEDIELFIRLYERTFLFIGNRFGNSAACFLARGVPQGAHPSPFIFIIVFNLIHVIARVCGRGCSAHGQEPSGSSGFADDTTLHTDGVDAVPAMQCIIQPAGEYLGWMGCSVNMFKSKIAAINFATGQTIATDSIKLNGVAFPALGSNQAHKQLGVRVALNGDFSQEKTHVLTEMQHRLSALKTDKVLSPTLKEMGIKIGVVPVFRYSAGVVPWSRAELEQISKLWMTAYKQAWSFSSNMDGSPIVLNRDDGGRECPSAVEEWTQAVLDLWDKCISLPGEISRIVTHTLNQGCLDHGCYALNQLQCLLRVSGKAESTTERLLLRLDEQGIVVSSPWLPSTETSIAEVLWPTIAAAWTEKQKWLGCRELADEVGKKWVQAKHCLSACKKLGQARLMTSKQLRNCAGTWRPRDELAHQNCLLTADEYAAVVLGLDSTSNVPNVELTGEQNGSSSSPHQVPPALPTVCTAYFGVLPPCIHGRVVEQLEGDQVEIECVPITGVPAEQLISATSNEALIRHLCKTRAVFSFTEDGSYYRQVECLAPVQSAAPAAQCPDSVIVCVFQQEQTFTAAPLAIFTAALIRDTLRDNGIELLHAACCRPRWRVSKRDLKDWYFSLDSTEAFSSGTAPSMKCAVADGDGQSRITGLSRYVKRRKTRPLKRSVLSLHPWQRDPPLPQNVTIDLTNHLPRRMPCPEGWEVLQRNGRTLITAPNLGSVGIDSAQYGMLCAMQSEQQNQSIPSSLFLRHLRASCLAQQRADAEYQVHWSRHLLASLQRITGAELLIGSRAVAYNPHFRFFASPFTGDRWLGATPVWPSVTALLTLDSFEPTARTKLWQSVAVHKSPIWILLQERQSAVFLQDTAEMRRLGARLCAMLSSKSNVVHETACWADAKWDVHPARSATQIWKVEPAFAADTIHLNIPPLLGSWDGRRYDFHWCHEKTPATLRLHQENQQDALRHTWDGHIAGTDGGVQWKNQRMGAGFAVGTDKVTAAVLAVRVGGPLSSLRAEAAGLLQLLCSLRTSHPAPLLVFVDSLVLLNILQNWGTANFNPEPNDVVHFDVILPLLEVLRQWPHPVRLVKVKSHTGCLMNEMADEQAELGYDDAAQEVCQAPQKFGSLALRTRQHVRELAQKCKKELPRDSAPNRKILKSVVGANTRRAACMRSTFFVRQLLHQKEGETIARVVSRCREAEYRVWVKAMTGRYPVQTYLHRIKLVSSPNCPFCPGVRETLTHFACICPQFREARTAAHNQVRKTICTFLTRLMSKQWKIYEETPMSKTGLRLELVPAACMEAAGRLLPEHHADLVSVERLQPDLVMVSWTLKKIGLVEVCRPMDEFSDQLTAAEARKLRTYAPLLDALRAYVAEGWTIEILPWVVGVRGLLVKASTWHVLDFLSVPRKSWDSVIEGAAIASVKAFYFLHQVRCKALHPSNPAKGQRKNFDTDDPRRSCNRKRSRRSDEDYNETRKKWQQMERNTRRRC